MKQAASYLHQIIRNAVTRRPAYLLDDALQLWEHLCEELVPIIGSGGFGALYQRSLNLASQDFPWIVGNDPSAAVHTSFRELTSLLSHRDPAEATEAMIAVMIIFTDVLAKLIGTSLTARILSSAWGDDAFQISVPEQQK